MRSLTACVGGSLLNPPARRTGQFQAYGATRGRSIALGYVTAEEPGLPRSWYESGHYEIELARERHAARVSLQPMYDPKSERPQS